MTGWDPHHMRDPSNPSPAPQPSSPYPTICSHQPLDALAPLLHAPVRAGHAPRGRLGAQADPPQRAGHVRRPEARVAPGTRCVDGVDPVNSVRLSRTQHTHTYVRRTGVQGAPPPALGLDGPAHRHARAPHHPAGGADAGHQPAAAAGPQARPPQPAPLLPDASGRLEDGAPRHDRVWGQAAQQPALQHLDGPVHVPLPQGRRQRSAGERQPRVQRRVQEGRARPRYRDPARHAAQHLGLLGPGTYWLWAQRHTPPPTHHHRPTRHYTTPLPTRNHRGPRTATPT